MRCRFPTRQAWLAAPGVLVLLLARCGYPGDPLPPALNIPEAILDLRVVQRADQLALTFTVPQLTTEGLTLELGGVEARVGAEDSATVPLTVTDMGAVEAAVPVSAYVGRTVPVAVRAVHRRGRPGAWSNTVVVAVRPPLPTPVGVQARGAAEGLQLTWSAPGTPQDAQFRVLRRNAEEESEEAEVGRTPTAGFLDRSAQFGVAYVYRVQTVAPAGDTEAVSEWSTAEKVQATDNFSPAAPAGLSAVVGVGSVALTWERSAAPDLGGYRVYRAQGEGTWERVADAITVPAYSDRTIGAGQSYRYRVTAVDRVGNESDPSAVTTAAVP